MTKPIGKEYEKPLKPWQAKAHEVIFNADTFEGKFFDIMLLVSIIVSVLAVVLESVQSLEHRYGLYFDITEWVFTIGFTIEYILRLCTIRRPWRYVFSFYGLVDLVSVLPTYLSIFFASSHSLLAIRALRLLRVFRVLKLARYLQGADILVQAIKASRYKIFVFVTAVLTLALIMGTTMYLIEGEEHGFTSIPTGIYWAIVTMTTVGYGDIAPQTPLGQFVAMILMIMGYGIIAVPTGIMSVELSNVQKSQLRVHACPSCSAEDHDHDANYCKHCGAVL